MAGFKRPTLKPVFTGDLEGFELEARRMTLDQLLTLSEMSTIDMDDKEQTEKVWAGVCSVLADLVIRWNLTDDDGNAEPVTLEAIQGLDVDFVLAIANALTRKAKPDADLGKDSNAGDTSVEASLTMVPLSESQAS